MTGTEDVERAVWAQIDAHPLLAAFCRQELVKAAIDAVIPMVIAETSQQLGDQIADHLADQMPSTVLSHLLLGAAEGTLTVGPGARLSVPRARNSLIEPSRPPQVLLRDDLAQTLVVRFAEDGGEHR